MADFLRLTGIHKSFGGVQALKGIDFSIGKSEIHCLAGENGSGKSTLIKIISGNLQPDMNRLLKQTEFYLALVIIILGMVITIFNPRFLGAENIFDLMKSFSVVGIMAVGVLFVLILGGTPDVSFTAIAQVVEYVVVIMTLKIVGQELNVIAAVFLGGASVFGGSGTVIGTFLGIMLLAIVNNGLTLLGISSYTI